MKRLLITLAITGLLLTAPSQANAIFIVDTDPGPTNPFTGIALQNSGGGISWLAGQFTTGQDYTVTSISGWIGQIGNPNVTTGNIDAVIYGDGALGPDAGNEFFRQTFVGPLMGQPEAGWYGPSGLNFNLNSGTYWVAMEVINENDFIGSMPSPVTGTPLAFYKNDNGGDQVYNINAIGQSFGFRIEALDDDPNGGGDPNAIPEPATMLLFGSGLAGAFVRRKLKG